MNPTYDLIVVGGGVVGASAAFHAARAGAKALLIDRMDTGRATDAGAGVLAPEMNRRDPEAWVEFVVTATAYYPALLDLLAAEDAGDTSYARCGMLLLASTEDEIGPYREAEQGILARMERRNAPSPRDLHPVSADDARALFPALGEVYGALYFRHAARVDGRLLAQALRRAGERRGLSILQASVEQLEMVGNNVTGVVVNGEVYSAGSVIIAGGAWSAQFEAQLGCKIPIEPQRGQIIHLEMPTGNTESWPILTAFRSHYIVPWAQGRIVVGATRETGSGFRPYTTVEGIQEVLNEAVRVAPGLAKAAFREVRVGLRPLTRDGMPVLGRVPGVEGVLLATGHGPTGLQLGPYSGKLMAEMALGKEPSEDISFFDVARFQRTTSI